VPSTDPPISSTGTILSESKNLSNFRGSLHIVVEGCPGATLFVIAIGAVLDPVIAIFGWVLAEKIANKLKGAQGDVGGTGGHS
jgi:cobalamin synthase